MEVDDPKKLAAVSAPYWMYLNKILIDGVPFDLKGRKYQYDIMTPFTPEGEFKHNEVIRKGSQTGATIGKVGEVTHGAIHGKYPQGIIFYFPSSKAVEMFSASRFKPFIEDNKVSIGKYVGQDRIDYRKIGNTKVYFFGATATSRVKEKKDAMAVRSTPADWILLDERDLFDETMATQVDQRLGNSKIWRRTDMGTPTIPDFGVDLIYKLSNQGRWQIPCNSCRKYTCLETEFPQCISLTLESEGVLVCVHCGKRINPDDGSWQADYPKRDTIGYWTSQLLNPNCKLRLILKRYEDPEAHGTTAGEFQRITLGQAHIDADDELQESDVFACCGRDPMAISSTIPCAMGVDIGKKWLYAVIGYRLDRNRYRIIKIAKVPDFDALHDLAVRFNVKSSVLDAQPEFHKCREWQKAEKHAVYLCYTPDNQKQDIVWTPDNQIKVLRNYLFDATHAMIRDEGVTTIPRICEEVKLFANHLTKTVRVQEIDKRTDSPVFRYRRRGDKEDHYRCGMNYFYLACKKVGIAPSPYSKRKQEEVQDLSYAF